ncbi:MAG: uncharacterized protein A8A55_2234 [Amphiamblys sp. WSBS2006]|nr:MAG: uncharacterized protein A8A55_2234 [Amphiamblys sp. WSBS2006]
MEPEATRTLKLGNTFFVFTHQSLFLFPENEYKSFQQDKEGYTCLKRKHLSVVTDRDTGRLICIVCHEEAKLEDFVSPLCRQLHFVLCRACVEYLKKRTNRREVTCPYCKEKKSDKAYQEEIFGILFSLMPHKTLTSLKIRPDMKVKTVTKLTRETKVILSNIAVTDTFFFRLMSKTAVTIRNKISLVGHDNSTDWCIRKFAQSAKERINICFDGSTGEEMKQIYENTKTIPKNSIQIKAGGIRAVGSNIRVLLKLLGSADGYSPALLLKSSNREHVKEILKEENNSLWVGKVKALRLEEHALETLPKLGIHEENEMEELGLYADRPEHIAGILKTENSSIRIGKMKRLELGCFALGTLPKLRIHEENMMEELGLYADKTEYTTEILKTKNNSIWVGKVKDLNLRRYAVQTLPKLSLHEENEMEVFRLDARCLGEITGALKTERKSIWIGKVKRLDLGYYAVGILPKLRVHKENVMEEFRLWADNAAYTTRILKEESNSIWIGKVGKLRLGGYAVGILPKLRIHEENVMEELGLYADKTKHLTEILKAENNSIWVGKVKGLGLGRYAIEILPKLRIHEENVMEELSLDVCDPGFISELLKMKNKCIWVGKVKKLKLKGSTVEILPKFRIHKENEMEELVLSTDHSYNTNRILKTENNSIWVGKVKRLELNMYAIQILPKLRLHEENVLEELVPSAYDTDHITEMLKKENSIWIGKVKKLKLGGYAVQILPKLRIHGENVMEEFSLEAYRPEQIVGILKMENKSIRVGKVWKISLEGHAEKIKDRLDFTLMDDARE